MEAAPPAGAALGSFAAKQSGYGQYAGIAGAVGWMVGSWLMGRSQQDKNEIIDPGAQEMPRVNQALRGSTLGVAFGTNRISSHIVHAGNFTTNRQEQNSGSDGGKGSGGGKGGGGSNEASYNYAWDVTYHCGMFPMGYQLLGGWLGGDRIATSVISLIQATTQAELSPMQQFFIAAQSNTEDNAAFISFEQAVYWPGGNQEIGWSYLQTQLGAIIRWPWTAWVGFKQLNLGAQPHIPQLSWEIGPSSFDGTCGTDDVVGAATLSDTADHCTNWTTDAYGRWYIYAETGSCYCINRDGTVAWEMTLAEYKTAWVTEFSQGVTLIQQAHVALVKDQYNFEWIILYGYVWAVGVDLMYSVMIAPITADGSTADPEIVQGVVWKDIPLNADFVSCEMIRLGFPGAEPPPISEEPPSQDHLLIAFQPTSSLRAQYWLSPPFHEIMAGRFDDSGVRSEYGSYTWREKEVVNFKIKFADTGDIVSYQFEESITASTYHNHSKMGQGFTLEERNFSAETGLDAVHNYRVWYKGWATMEWQRSLTLPNAWLTTQEPTYPNGMMCKTDLRLPVIYKEIEDTMVSGSSNIFDNPLLADPSIINDKWLDQDGQHIVPYPIVNTTISDGEPDVLTYGFDYGERPLIRRLNEETGEAIIIFAGNSRNEIDADPDLDEEVLTNMQLFYYDPHTGIAQQFLELQCGSGNKTAGWGTSTTPDEYRTVLAMPWFDDNGVLYLYNITTAGKIVITDWGVLDLDTGNDVYPPYIIREILTHDEFGAGFLISDIDDTSYLAALNYCIDNNFKLSVQYLREQATLQIIEELLDTYAGYLIFSDGKIKFGLKMDGATAVRTIDNDHLLVDSPGEAPVIIHQGAAQDTFNKVRVNYIDRGLDYHQNQVEISDEVDQDLNGVRMREFPPIFVMERGFAATIAARTMWANRFIRDQYEFKLGWKDADLEPGDVVTLVDSHYPFLVNGVDVRINQWVERDRGKFSVIATQENQQIFTNSQSAIGVSSASIAPGVGPVPGVLDQWVYELPNKYQINGGMIYASYVPDALAHSATAYVSTDGLTYSRSTTISPMPISGVLLADLNSDESFVENNIEIVMFPNSDWVVGSETFVYSTTLAEVGDGMRAAGAGLLWVGSEMLAYEGVNLVSQNRYKFNRVYRGWGGTHIHSHSSGDNFSKHGGGIFNIPFNEAQIGLNIYVKIAPRNFGGVESDLSSITAVQYSIQGTHFRPQIAPTPRLIVGSRDYGGCYRIGVADSADVTLDWRDSSRSSGNGMGGYGIGGFGRFTTDVLSHSWRVEIVGSGDVVVRSLEVSTATYTYPGSTNAADNGDWRGNVTFKVTPFGEHGDATRTEISSLELF